QFVETAEEVVEAELLRCRRLDLPREETPDGVAAHDAVEQGDHLSRPPNVLALDRGEDQVLPLDLCERRSDSGRGKIRHRASTGRTSGGARLCGRALWRGPFPPARSSVRSALKHRVSEPIGPGRSRYTRRNWRHHVFEAPRRGRISCTAGGSSRVTASWRRPRSWFRH